jgi:electron transport complex protein RnfC
MGSEKQLVTTVTGREIPAGKLSAEIGVSVHNVGTALAVCRAVRFAKPLVSRVVTMGGGAIRNPRNVVVPIGTPVADLVEFCGGFTVTPSRVLMGGPMMGQVLPGLEAPVVKGTSGIIALTAAEAHAASQRACLHCGRCVDVCPVGLVPLDLAARVRAGRIDDAAELGMGDCLSCGCCAYVCPAHLPLAHLFNYAKGEIAARREAQRKAEDTRKLAEARRLRLAAEIAAKAARRSARSSDNVEIGS